jgi:oligosaccharyltransferase complex subunit delta (ribophorin II)
MVSSKPLQASIVIGSFGSSQAFESKLLNIDVQIDANTPIPKYERPLRYGKLAEIHHIFRPDPRSPPKIISLVFVVAVLAAIPALFIAVRKPMSFSLVWLYWSVDGEYLIDL